MRASGLYNFKALCMFVVLGRVSVLSLSESQISDLTAACEKRRIKIQGVPISKLVSHIVLL